MADQSSHFQKGPNAGAAGGSGAAGAGARPKAAGDDPAAAIHQAAREAEKISKEAAAAAAGSAGAIPQSGQANAAGAAQPTASPGVTPLDLPNFASAGDSPAGPTGLGLLDDVTLRVKIELGRTHMYVEDVLRLNTNSIVELDKAAGDPVDIFVNERHVARGEVLVLNENFCVRVSEIIQQAPEE